MPRIERTAQAVWEGNVARGSGRFTAASSHAFEVLPYSLATRIGSRLLIGWLIALICGVAGLFLSYWWDLPSGAAIVCTFGALLIIVSLLSLFRPKSVT